MAPICPECFAGKHSNCNGNADMDDEGNFIACGCTDLAHYTINKI